jgi:Cu(I)/Ag(I) efflux system membrane fusion protein
MDLVPVMKKGVKLEGTQREAADHEFRVPVERQQQIGVTYAVVEKRRLRRAIRTVGIVSPDRSRQWSYVARAEGYVQDLYVTSPGQPVEEGSPLLTIYSPELLTAEREFVDLLDARDRPNGAGGRAANDRLLQASRARLKQWNITAKQIAELEKSRMPSELLTLTSPFTGVVESVAAEQGRRVAIGDSLVTVTDLSVAWVWVEFYENELSNIAKGQKAALTAASYPGQTFEGKVALIDPFLNEATRTLKARIDVANIGMKFRPGMYVDVELMVDSGEGLAIPVGAIIPTGLHSLVFLDKGEGRLEPRFVQIGDRYGGIYQVRAGLAEGERVVASANFLIDAESKIQGAALSFEEPAGISK